MIFEFFKKIFWNADEGNRKRKPDDFSASNRENYSPSKRHCSESLMLAQKKIIDETDRSHQSYCNHGSKNKMPVLKPSVLENQINSYGNRNNSECQRPLRNFNGQGSSSNHKISQNDHIFWPKQKSFNQSTLFETHKLNTRKQYEELLLNYTLSKDSGSTSRLSESRMSTEKLYPDKVQNLSKSDVTSIYKSIKKMDDVQDSQQQMHKSNNLSFSLQKMFNRCGINSEKDNLDKTIPSCSTKEPPAPVMEINTMRESLSSKAVTKPDFVAEIMKKYNARIEERNREAEKLKKMTSALSRQNQMIREAVLENQLSRSMKLYEEILDEKLFLQVEPELPKLTSDMMERIKAALSSGPGHEILVQDFGLRITRKDMQTLSGLNWLNDEIINFYMNLLIKRGSLDNFPNVYAMNTFFYPKLLSGGHSSLKRWTRKVDLFSKDFIIVPVHLGIHWCMSVIDLKNKSIRYFDSMGSPNHKCLQVLKQYLQDEHLDKKKTSFDFSNWSFESVKDIPQQTNGSDCGVFSCVFAEHICANKDFNFSQDDMPYFRNKMVYEILTAQLL